MLNEQKPNAEGPELDEKQLDEVSGGNQAENQAERKLSNLGNGALGPLIGTINAKLTPVPNDG